MPKYVVIIFVLALAVKASAQELRWHKEVYKGNTFDLVDFIDTTIVIDPIDGKEIISTSQTKTARTINGDTIYRNLFYKDYPHYSLIDTATNNITEIIMSNLRADLSGVLEDAIYSIDCRNIVVDAGGNMVYFSEAGIDSFYYSEGRNANVVLDAGKRTMVNTRIRSILEKQKFKTLIVNNRPVPYTFFIFKAIRVKDHDITELN